MKPLKLWRDETGRLTATPDDFREFIIQPREREVNVNNNWSNVDDSNVPPLVVERGMLCPYKGNNRHWEVNEEGTYRIVVTGTDPANRLAVFYPLPEVVT